MLVEAPMTLFGIPIRFRLIGIGAILGKLIGK